MHKHSPTKHGHYALAVVIGLAWGFGMLAAANASAATTPLAQRASTALVGCRNIQAIKVTNQTPRRVSASALRRDERAVEIQSAQVARAWNSPCVRFTSSGWPLKIVANAIVSCARGDQGCHGSDSFATAAGVSFSDPRITVGVPGGWRITLSHEVIETLVDPSGVGREVCDPVQAYSYLIDGIPVSAYVKPNHEGAV